MFEKVFISPIHNIQNLRLPQMSCKYQLYSSTMEMDINSGKVTQENIIINELKLNEKYR